MIVHLIRATAGRELHAYCTDAPPQGADLLTSDPDEFNCVTCLRMWTTWTEHLPPPPRLMLLDVEPVEINPDWTIITAEDNE